MNFSIVPKAFDCFRVGSALANPELWKVGGMGLSAAVGGFALSINALGKAAGYDLNIDQNTADALGAVAAWIVGCIFHVATTDKLGVLPSRPAGSSEPDHRPGPQPAPKPSDATGARLTQPAAPAAVQPRRGDLSRADDESMRAGG